MPLYPDVDPEVLVDMAEIMCDEASGRIGGVEAWYTDLAIEWLAQGASAEVISDDLPGVVSTAFAWKCPELLPEWEAMGE